MVAPMAANYANLFMDMYETSRQNDFPKKKKKWKKTLNMVNLKYHNPTKLSIPEMSASP